MTSGDIYVSVAPITPPCNFLKVTKLILLTALGLCCCVPAGSSSISPAIPGTLPLAVHQLYNSDFNASRLTLDAYSSLHPDDPLAYSLRAASYFFPELDRAGALNKNFLTDDTKIANRKSTAQAEQNRVALMKAFDEARNRGSAALAKDPGDPNALLAMCIVSGLHRDYLALVEHRWKDSYDYIKEAQSYSDRLLKVDPTAYDAYLNKGFTEYLIASMPFFLRWVVKVDDLTPSKEQGLEHLQIAANSGRYMKPFAQLLLAMFYLREKRDDKTRELLVALSREYPDNLTYRTELAKLDAKHKGKL